MPHRPTSFYDDSNSSVQKTTPSHHMILYISIITASSDLAFPMKRGRWPQVALVQKLPTGNPSLIPKGGQSGDKKGLPLQIPITPPKSICSGPADIITSMFTAMVQCSTYGLKGVLWTWPLRLLGVCQHRNSWTKGALLLAAAASYTMRRRGR